MGYRGVKSVMGLFSSWGRLRRFVGVLRLVSLGVIVAFLALLVLLLVMPLPLGMLSSWVEREVEQSFPGIDVELGHVEGVLSLREGTLAMRMVDVRLTSVDGASVGRVSDAALLFDIRAWLGGEQAPLWIRGFRGVGARVSLSRWVFPADMGGRVYGSVGRVFYAERYGAREHQEICC